MISVAEVARLPTLQNPEVWRLPLRRTPMIRGLLFDFDGTLADSFAAIAASTNSVRESFGLPAMTEAAVRKYVGHGLANLLGDLCPGCDVDLAVARYRAHHPSVMLAGTTLFPGVRETLALLHQRGYPMGVCSNKAVDFTRGLIAVLGLAELLPVVLGPEDVGVPKPDPAMLLEGCRRLGISHSEGLYIGDMVVDVQAAQAAGMPVWLVHVGMAGTEDPRDAGPDRILKDFAEMAELLPALR